MQGLHGVPGGIRTPDLLVRSQSLYPAELQAHRFNNIYYISFFVKSQAFFCILYDFPILSKINEYFCKLQQFHKILLTNLDLYDIIINVVRH